jgi:hypothetical protein
MSHHLLLCTTFTSDVTWQNEEVLFLPIVPDPLYTLSMKYTAVYYNNSSNLDLCVVIFSDTNGADFVCHMTFRFDIHMSVHHNIIPKLQPTICSVFDLFIFTDALHVSGGSSAHHQEHITVHTASGIVNQYCC